VIDVFSKFLQVVPLKSKTGPVITLAFKPYLQKINILNHTNDVHPLCGQVKAKNFLTRLSKTS